MENNLRGLLNNETMRSETRMSLEQRADEKRIRFLRRGILIGIVADVAFLFTGDLRQGFEMSARIDLTVITSFVAIFLGTYTFHRRHRVLYHAVIATLVVAMTASYYSPGATGGLFMIPVTILVAYLLLSRLGGTIWTGVIFATLLAVHILGEFEIVQSQLEFETVAAGVISLFLLSALIYVYEGINVGNEQLIIKRDQELFVLNEKLERQLVDNKDTADKLSRTLETTQKNNKLLYDSKLALMNVLDDANSLQNQLRVEKENVEKKVLERTEQLRHEQARLRASINSIGSALLMTFAEDQKAIYNPALLTLLGIEVTDDRLKSGTSKALTSVVQSVLKKSFDLDGSIKEAKLNKKPFHAESVEYADKFMSIYGSPILSEDRKETLGCVVVMDDKTESMLLERSKDEFISIASHELRTPLTAIRGNASMLVSMYGDQLPKGDIKEMVEDIKDASVRLIGIVNQFLSTSRLEQKRTIFTLVPVNIAKSLHDRVNELQDLAHEKKLAMICEVPKDLPKVLADEARTSEIITNVVGNAIKYTNKGSIRVRARVSGLYVEVDVEDTGIGIDAKNQGLLFHKFQQATSNILTRDDSRSTGLGLYITKLLTEQMGGRIYLKSSTVGKGSIFTFSLPIASPTVYSIIRQNEQ